MGSEDDDDDKKFDRRILIASIFFFLTVAFLMFFLHFYFKYLSRRREVRRRAALNRLINRQIAPDVTDLNSSNEPPKTGLEPTVIDSLPAFKFKADHNQLQDGEITECSVCLGTIVEDAMVRVLPNCKHMFHNDCIDAWFRSNVTCPICRTVAVPTVEPAEKKVGDGEVQPSAPPLDENTSQSGGGSGFLFGSFRWMVGRERSSTVRSCEDEVIGDQDLERR
ncbi:RING-H2 finger protein ATL40-like [Euphorbia lathyris]|uniref:RING-H2 finger protein ATL40-like n=1 Tax=Euphorbia lathyris TaxID=212925 RepID=UPI00331331CF